MINQVFFLSFFLNMPPKRLKNDSFFGGGGGYWLTLWSESVSGRDRESLSFLFLRRGGTECESFDLKLFLSSLLL